MQYKKILSDIRSLKIQGAENIAKKSVQAFSQAAQDIKAHRKEDFLNKLIQIKKELFATRPTEPCMRNAINSILGTLNKDYVAQLKLEISKKSDEITGHFNKADKIMTEIGSRKIMKDMNIFTHCHSSTVTNILIKAKKQGKSFTVHNTETRPRLQGRITAKELSAAGIKVTHYVDSAARLALKESDLMLIGADAITTEGQVINKIGSELSAEIAARYQIPLYICTNSWKFDPMTIFGYEEDIEKRKKTEVWKNPPKNVKISNFAFERINPNLITGIISELGIFKPHIFIEEVKRNYPWIF